MTIFYFNRPNTNDPRRIFIGINDTNKNYRIGHRTVSIGNKIRLRCHFYEINEVIEIINDPDFSLINDTDKEILRFYKIY